MLDRTAPRSRIPILDGPVIAAFAADPAHRLFLAGRAYRQTHGAVPPGVIESPASARSLLTIIADRYLHRDAVVGPS